MKVAYDKYYMTENLFGNPYPELTEFFAKYPKKGKLLDLGCGQGRNAISLARLGFDITGVDNSKVGIEQMNLLANNEKLILSGIVSDIYTHNDYADYDFVLLDSMFHFEKKDERKETEFIKRIISKIKKDCIVVFCIQDTGKKIKILNAIIDSEKRIIDKGFKYIYHDSKSNHKSTTDYRMIVIKKQNAK